MHDLLEISDTVPTPFTKSDPTSEHVIVGRGVIRLQANVLVVGARNVSQRFESYSHVLGYHDPQTLCREQVLDEARRWVDAYVGPISHGQLQLLPTLVRLDRPDGSCLVAENIWL